MSGLKVCCQTFAIGHITTEVIESVSVESKAIMNFELGTITKSDSNSSLQTKLDSKTLDLGTLTLYSGNYITCNIIINPTSLSNSAGNAFIFEPAIKDKAFSSTAKTDGSQTIQLDGRANIASNQASGLYQGFFTVVFAYN